MIKIEFYEYKFLLLSCIPPVPIARHSIWINSIDKYYHKFNAKERKDLFESITSRQNFGTEDEDCQLFYARYNPENQYLVTTEYEGEKKQHKAFMLDGKYHLSKSTSIEGQFIISATKLTN